MPVKRGDITGKVFTRLTVLGRGGKSKCNHILWKCVCECGNEIIRN